MKQSSVKQRMSANDIAKDMAQRRGDTAMVEKLQAMEVPKGS